MDRCQYCGEMLITEHEGAPGTDRPAGEPNPDLETRCPNPDCPSNTGAGGADHAQA
ncbi:hypothetical protein [Cellulomonas sp. ATA003]|uniref:hypothetical protein n=1 Tax=Cellulomonas sp. ATA003 TaxID=3073064 RepID=UPI0028731C0B|nr:hypothetical protein [Cellulomonas sp. ATA003]WNB87253.1 hypothetical protein REH70_09210 [Cellulomonas sp. ATA003]